MENSVGSRQVVVKYIFSAVVSALIGLSLAGCSTDKSLEKRAEAAYEKARDAMLRSPEHVEIDVVWLLRDLLEMAPDAELQELVNARTAAFANHPFRIMLDPNAPRMPLPEDPGMGMERYYAYMQAPFGEPKERAVQFIADYLSRPERGYMLTHQLTALVWARNTGLELPPELVAMKDGLLQQIHAEQSNEGGIFIMDLYAERAAFLLRYGQVPKRDAEKWVARLVAMQNSDGHWPASQAVLQYQGQFGSSLPPPPHTTVLAMMALKMYQTEYGLE